jgi:hypothetical protein
VAQPSFRRYRLHTRHAGVALHRLYREWVLLAGCA